MYVHVHVFLTLSLTRDILLLEAGFLTILVAPFNLAFWRKYVYVLVFAMSVGTCLYMYMFTFMCTYYMYFVYTTIGNLMHVV